MGKSHGAFSSCAICLFWLWHCPTCYRRLPLLQVMSLIILRSTPSFYFDLKPGKIANPWVALFVAICVAWTDGLLCIKPAVTVLRGICSILRRNSWQYLDLAVKGARSVYLGLGLTGWVWLLANHQGTAVWVRKENLSTKGESTSKEHPTIVRKRKDSFSLLSALLCDFGKSFVSWYLIDKLSSDW